MMKKELLYVVACVLILMPLSVSHVAAQGNETRDEGELSEDSVVNIIAYFSKNDTLTYVYDYQEMSVDNGDTVSVRKLSRDISIVVTDSPKMEILIVLPQVEPMLLPPYSFRTYSCSFSASIGVISARPASRTRIKLTVAPNFFLSDSRALKMDSRS